MWPVVIFLRVIFKCTFYVWYATSLCVSHWRCIITWCLTLFNQKGRQQTLLDDEKETHLTRLSLKLASVGEASNKLVQCACASCSRYSSHHQLNSRSQQTSHRLEADNVIPWPWSIHLGWRKLICSQVWK